MSERVDVGWAVAPVPGRRRGVRIYVETGLQRGKILVTHARGDLSVPHELTVSPGLEGALRDRLRRLTDEQLEELIETYATKGRRIDDRRRAEDLGAPLWRRPRRTR